MGRFPDFSSLARRSLLYPLAAGLVAAGWWMSYAAADASRETEAAQTEGPPAPGGSEAGANGTAKREPEADALVELGQQLWDEYVPAQIREQYAFPSMEELRAFLARVEASLHTDSARELARYERDARRALRLLRRYQGGDLFAAWLEPRLDLIKAAAQIDSAAPGAWPQLPSTPERIEEDGTIKRDDARVEPAVLRPQYTREYWDKVVTRRRVPARAAELVPRLKEIFAASGLPQELVWMAEVESSMNPEATSPVGARGLFQFMPLTAARFGLETGVLIDERTDPEKSARAAAEYLRVLHRRFRSWPLALAAYNAGEGRVGRALAAQNAETFEAVSPRLPIETRMYVPKVLATVAAREAVDPEALPPPSPRDSARSDWVSEGGGDGPGRSTPPEPTASPSL